MRMHSYGKCSPSLSLGAVTIFSLIVLYGYWNLSAHNRDLLQKLHQAESEAILLGKKISGVEALNEEVKGEESKLQFKLMEEEVKTKEFKKKLSEKDMNILNLNTQIQNQAKQIQDLTEKNKRSEDEVANKERARVELESRVLLLESELTQEREKKKGAAVSEKEPTKTLDIALEMDPAEVQMNPDVGKESIPIPGKESNLDAAEDDNDREHVLKDDGVDEDQQPDGTLQKQLPPPGTINEKDINHNDNNNRQIGNNLI